MYQPSHDRGGGLHGSSVIAPLSAEGPGIILVHTIHRSYIGTPAKIRFTKKRYMNDEY